MIIQCIAKTNNTAFDKLNKVMKTYDCYMNVNRHFSFITELEKTRYALYIYMEIILDCEEDMNIWLFKTV